MPTFTYFAYGSNMLTERLRERCPSARPIGTAIAHGYSLGFCKRSDKDGSGKAALLPDDAPGAEVHGVLFEIDKRERLELDNAEGKGGGYERDDAFKVIRDGEEITTTTYMMSTSHRDDSLKPYDWYHALTLAGALQHGLAEGYIESLRKVETPFDSDPKRREKAMQSLRKAKYAHLLSKYPDGLEIAPRWTVGNWRRLTLDPKKPNTEDWKTALKIFEARIRGRFLNPADVLIAHEISQYRKTFGFAILAIDFLVIETLQGFYDGKEEHKSESQELVNRFLQRWAPFKCAYKSCKPNKPCNEKQLADKIYEGYRSGLYHSGATDGALRVLAIGPTFDFRNYKAKKEIVINRTRFHEKLKHAFNSYLDELRESGAVDLRSKFKTKMDWICGIEKSEV